jgi:hypothetical protein
MRMLLVALACAVVAVGCGVPQDEQPRALDPGAAPFRVFEPEVAPSPEGDLAVELWFVRSDRLVAVQRTVRLPGSPQQVLSALFTGLTDAERAAGLASSIPSGVSFQGVEVQERIAVVNLDVLDVQSQVLALQPLAFAQIVATLDGRPEIDGVRFRAGGSDVQVPRGDGSLTDAPVNRESYADLLGTAEGANAVPPPPVVPAPGEVLPGEVPPVEAEPAPG